MAGGVKYGLIFNHRKYDVDPHRLFNSFSGGGLTTDISRLCLPTVPKMFPKTMSDPNITFWWLDGMVNPPDVEPAKIRIYPTGEGSVKIDMPTSLW